MECLQPFTVFQYGDPGDCSSLFSLNGDRLAFDAESGALHIAWTKRPILFYRLRMDAGQKPPSAQALEKLADRYGSAVFARQQEILDARDQGLMFVPDVEIKPEQLYPGEPWIKSMCLHLCHDCNLRCRYCFAGTGDFRNRTPQHAQRRNWSQGH